MPHDPSPHLLHLRLPAAPSEPRAARAPRSLPSLPKLPFSKILPGISEDEYRSMNPQRARPLRKRLELSLLGSTVEMCRDIIPAAGERSVTRKPARPRMSVSVMKQPRALPPLRFRLPRIRLQFPTLAWGLPELSLPFAWQRSIAGFLIFSILLLSPFEIASRVTAAATLALRVPSESSSALDRLLAGVSSGDPSAAQAAAETFSLARYDLNKALGLLGGIPAFLPVASQKIESGARLLAAAESLSEAATVVATGVQTARADGTPVARIRVLRNAFGTALPLLDQALTSLAGVNPEALPELSPEVLRNVTDLVATSQAAITDLLRATDVATALFGSDEPRRYLFVFQNNTELRPTGGFIGSFAEVDVRRGEILALRMPGGGSYDLQGTLRERVAAPQPLQLIQPTWQFQDANWFPDFPTSAKKLAWFYEKSGGPTVDGVVAITAGLVTDILRVVGPIEMPEYGRTISAENFIAETQKIVELEYDREENKPKQFLADLAPRLILRIRNASQEEMLSLLAVIDRGLRSRDVQFQTRNPELQAQIVSLGWSGMILETSGDYLSLVHANIGGQKTDAVIENRVHHHADISPDGEVTVTVTIERDHRGVPGELFTGVRNVDYVRAYAPFGSVLLSATGFVAPPPELFEPLPDGTMVDTDLAVVEGAGVTAIEGTRVTEEFGKTVFGNWIQVDPGETARAELRYRLPFRLELTGATDPAAYTLLVQKQPGLRSLIFRHSVSLPQGSRAAWTYPETVPAPMTGDLLFGTLITHE